MSEYILPVQVGEDEYLLVNFCSGAIDVIDKELRDRLIALKGTSFGRNAFPEHTFRILEERGHITDKSREELLEYMEKMCEILKTQLNQKRQRTSL